METEVAWGLMPRKNFLILWPLLIGCGFGLLTWVMIGNHSWHINGPQRLGDVIMLLVMPGFLIAFVESHNIHAAHSWIVVIGNVCVYYLVSYLLVRLWLRLTA
jgi:hypothetical protein